MSRLLLSASALILGSALSLSSPTVQAQGFPNIFEDIFKGNKQTGPYGGQMNGVYVENIPLNVTFDSRADLLPPEATLIITAIAPPPPNVRRANPLIMGETRLLISRLAPPIQMVVAVPSDMARDIDYALIKARIIDVNGNTTHRLRERVEYSGGQPPFIELIPEGAITTQKPAISGHPASPPQSQPYPDPDPDIGQNIITLSGQANINGNTPIMRGGHLVIRILEAGLAGGLSSNTIFEERIDIDGQQAPFDFALYVPTGADGQLDAPEVEAYIEDWAGRKTHIMSAPVAFTPHAPGQARVDLRLDSLISGSQAVPADQFYVPPVSALQNVSGIANITAPRGLPAGSTLIVELVDTQDISRIIAQDKTALDGLSGNVDFNFTVEKSSLRQNGQGYLIARIEDRNGQVLLATRSLATLGTTHMSLDLQPTELY